VATVMRVVVVEAIDHDDEPNPRARCQQHESRPGENGLCDRLQHVRHELVTATVPTQGNLSYT
jgi:hypothetical protein